mmetsp:Transcript_51066/g.163435  ORF Transcript_51066/g.163435 Transcript_51066/m.163435 type:complete len:253 (-) Transcript_51066:2-760(-)
MMLSAEKLEMCFRATPRTGASPAFGVAAFGVGAFGEGAAASSSSSAGASSTHMRDCEKFRRMGSRFKSWDATCEASGTSAAAASTEDSAMRRSFFSSAWRALSCSSSVLARGRRCTGSGASETSTAALPQAVFAVVSLPAAGVTLRFVACRVSQVTAPVRSSRCTTNLNSTGWPGGSFRGSEDQEGKVSAVVSRGKARPGDQLPRASWLPRRKTASPGRVSRHSTTKVTDILLGGAQAADPGALPHGVKLQT